MTDTSTDASQVEQQIRRRLQSYNPAGTAHHDIAWLLAELDNARAHIADDHVLLNAIYEFTRTVAKRMSEVEALLRLIEGLNPAESGRAFRPVERPGVPGRDKPRGDGRDG